MADLNSTIVRGNLRVTEEIIGPLNVTNLSAGANGQFLSVSNNVPTWVNNPNTWRPLGTGANDAAAGNHSHDGRYLRWAGSAADASAMTWGTLTANNGYNILSHASSSDGGDWGMTYQGGKIYMQLDGYYYQNEGQYRVLDTSDSSSFAEAGHGHTKSEVGLGNVDNTADANKRVDYANSAGSVAWNNISSKPITITQKNNDSPVSGAYAYGTYVTMRNTNNWFEIYAPHMGTSSSRVYMQTGWDNDRQGWKAIAWTSDIPTSLPASDVYAWAKEPTKPTYTKSEVGLGNVDNTADANKNVNYANSAGSANYFNYGRGAILANSSSFTNNFCKDIFGEENNNNYHLVALRTNSQAPSCLLGDYSSGIAWKGSDTYGSLMVRYNTSEIRVSGGNGANSNPKWTVDLVHSGNIGSQNVNYANGAGNADTVDGKHASEFATSGHTHSNYVTTDTAQTISGAKTFSNTITANNWLYVPYIGTKTNKLYIEGPWNGAGQEQPTLTFEDGALKAYNWEDDGESVYESMFDFRFPYGVQMNASGASIYLNGNNNCYLQSTAKGWMVNGSDQYGCIYPAASNNGKIGLPANHFYQGYINYIYTNTIYPISSSGTSTGSNIGAVGNTASYFASGAFRTIYRSSESGLSDIRLKQNISNNDLNALEIINNLNIINFQYDDDIKIEAKNKKQRLKAINTMKELPKTKETKELRKELQKIIATPNNEDMITIGVSAQQLQELLPKKYQKTFIQKESTNQYADQLFIKENRLVYLSFKAIQEQQAIIGSLEEKINLLEEKINALEEKMKKEVN